MTDGGEQLFKGGWLSDPKELQGRAKRLRVNLLTAEMAAWCGEVHEHLAELAAVRSLPLLLMGGNAAALRLEVAKQRGRRDNDYLTSASENDIEALMAAFSDRFAVLHPDFIPYRHRPKHPERDLPLATYQIPIPLQLNHGNVLEATVKVEFHIDADLPPGEELEAEFGPMEERVRARVPKLPYQIGLKLMTLVTPPIGISRNREDAVPRQLYDLDELLGQVRTKPDWSRLGEYIAARYASEARAAEVLPATDGPGPEIETRLRYWADCLDDTSSQWIEIRRCQESQLRREARLPPWGWRARSFRLVVAVRCLRRPEDGLTLWRRAHVLAGRVPEKGAKRLRGPLAEAFNIDPGSTPAGLDLRHWVWQMLADSGELQSDLARLEKAIEPAVA